MVNLAVVVGKLVKSPQIRALPSGLQLIGFDLRVQRPEEAADMVPVVLFVPDAGEPAWAVGEELVVVGRVRRRFFRAGGGTQSRTEVIADSVVRASKRDEAAEALSKVAGTLRYALDEVARQHRAAESRSNG
jgi:single-strand DNA-binding protein